MRLLRLLIVMTDHYQGAYPTMCVHDKSAVNPIEATLHGVHLSPIPFLYVCNVCHRMPGVTDQF